MSDKEEGVNVKRSCLDCKFGFAGKDDIDITFCSWMPVDVPLWLGVRSCLISFNKEQIYINCPAWQKGGE